MSTKLLLISALFLCANCFAKPSFTLISRTHENGHIYPTLENNFYQKIFQSDFDVQLTSTSHARLLESLNSKDSICTYNIIKTAKREAKYLFSTIPTVLYEQRRVYGTTNSLDKLPESVSIAKLLAQGKRIAVAGASSYDALDAVFEKYSSQILFINGENRFKRIAPILFKQRVDLIIEYDKILEEMLTKEQYSSLSSRTIQEYPLFAKGYFACSKTALNKQVIKVLHSQLLTKQGYEFLNMIHQQIFPPETVKEMMKLYAQKYNVRLTTKK